MASLIYEVFSKPAVRDALIQDPAKITVAVEELLRLRPPFFGFFRRTTKPAVVADTPIPSGHDVYVGWAAANRDPRVFESPGEFKLDRGSNRHMSFGLGIHRLAPRDLQAGPAKKLLRPMSTARSRLG
jgi:cytochrome P450